ncbi:hypothetical protein HPB50_023942 [Hyalomma asiaticum]|uniref:Uncharacterized protein n=1 Tax=Hyalomma asiaticum TaxID=266040 RepID=A0ACB7T6Y4_HYAAI|nr:hypothetical protein HPB50_023942 [Hyalomma asiaticum]
MDGSVGAPEGARESSPRKPERSVDSSHQCRSCGLCFSREEYFKSHQNQCQAKFACSVCGKRFASMRTLVPHQRVHSGNKPHACQVCGRKFAARASMVRHELIHTGERPYACEVCPSRFTKKESLDKHKNCMPVEWTCFTVRVVALPSAR